MSSIDTKHPVEILSVFLEKKNSEDGKRTWDACFADCLVYGFDAEPIPTKLSLPVTLKDVPAGTYYMEIGLYRSFDLTLVPAVIGLHKSDDIDLVQKPSLES